MGALRIFAGRASPEKKSGKGPPHYRVGTALTTGASICHDASTQFARKKHLTEVFPVVGLH